jgi:acyl carrier protein
MTEQAREIIEFIRREVMRNTDVELDETTPLVSSGLIDSMALVDILGKLEDVTNMRIPAGKVQAKDMDTVQLMFATALRVGRIRKKG